MNKRRITVSLAGALALASIAALSACSSASTPAASSTTALSPAQCVAQGTTTLDVAYTATGEPSVKIAVSDLEKKYKGLKITATVSSAPDYTTMAQQIIADKAAGKDVDVAQVGNDQIRLFVDTYGLKPFDESLLPKTFDKTYLPIGEMNGKVYAVPFQISIPAMFINQDAFTKAGISTPPTSLDEVLTDARKLKTATGDSSIVGINSGPSSDDWYIQAFAESYGGTLANSDGTAAFDSAAGTKALDFYSTAAKEGLLLHKVTNDTVAAFVSGQLPILFQSTAAVPTLDKLIGDKFPWTASLMPTTKTPSYAAGGNSWVPIATDPCRAELADAFIADMVTPKALAPSLLAYSYQPVDTEVNKEMHASSTVNAKSKPLLDVKAKLSGRNLWPGSHTPEVQQIIADMTEQIVGGADVKTQLKSTVDKIDQTVR